jgi:ABC-type sugar transport system substrate-binding protein
VKKVISICAAIVMMMSVAACGSDGNGGGANPNPASAGGAKLASGTIGILEINGQSEVITHWANTAKKAATAMGWKATIADGKGDPSVWAQAMQNFVNQKVDGIITLAIDPAPIAAQLKAAKDAGIPVIASGITVSDPGQYAAMYAPDDAEFGRVLAENLKKSVPVGSEYVAFDASAISGAHKLVTEANPLLTQAGFRLVGNHDLNLSDIVNDVSKGTADLIAAHPNAKFLLSCCDFTPPIMVAAFKQAGKPTVITAGRYDNLSSLKLIREGAPVVVAAANADTGVLTAVDQIFATTATKADVDPDADKGKYEFKFIDKTNAPAAGEFVYDPDTQIAESVKNWNAEYER